MVVTPYTIGKTAFLLLDLIATVGIFVLAFACGVLGLSVYGMFSLIELNWDDFTISNAPGGGNEIVEIFDFVSLGEWVGIFRSNWLDDWLGDWLGDLPGNLLFSANSDGDVFVIFFYTTLFTSVWVWLFMLGGVLWPLFTWLRGVLLVDKFPVGSAMAIGGLFAGLVVTALGYVRMAALS